MVKSKFFSSGKLLLSGEYLVLNGAQALAVPTIKGQEMNVEIFNGSGNVHWTAHDYNGKVWLNASFILQHDHFIPVCVGSLEIPPKVLLLQKILNNALTLNPEMVSHNSDYEIKTNLQFSLDWGLGSSSTLICNIAKWANIDAHRLFFSSLEGSGYDVAVGMVQKPIIYRLENKFPFWDIIEFNPSFSNNLYFVYLNKKQISNTETSKYLINKAWTANHIEEINHITSEIAKCDDLKNFELLITEHEKLMSSVLNQKPVKNILFSDFSGAIKSLGAWGGDFILACGNDAPNYFSSKGFNTILRWEEMILR